MTRSMSTNQITVDEDIARSPAVEFLHLLKRDPRIETLIWQSDQASAPTTIQVNTDDGCLAMSLLE